MPVTDELGTRMKEFYENRSKTYLTRRTPVAIRLDGKSFHTYVKNFERPFDDVLIGTMRDTMKYLCENIQGCVLGYTQSDEITLILVDYKTLTSDAWFDYSVQKLCSISASMATMAFNKALAERVEGFRKSHNDTYSESKFKLLKAYEKAIEQGAIFDSRCFNIPKEEVANLLLWRQNDATRNSIQMVGQANFSHKELNRKTCNDIQDMLFTQKGVNWNDFPTHKKRGSCCVRMPYYVETPVGEVERWEWRVDTEIPIFVNDGRKYIEDRIIFKETK